MVIFPTIESWWRRHDVSSKGRGRKVPRERTIWLPGATENRNLMDWVAFTFPEHRVPECILSPTAFAVCDDQKRAM